MSGTTNSDSSQQWAALDSRNERLVEASHPLLRTLKRDKPENDRPAAAAR
jgi:hypothetical protein